MKRVVTSLAVLLVVFVIFALVIGPLRKTPVEVGILFFPTIITSAETLAYVSFFVGLLLATLIAFIGDMALRKRFRATMLEQSKRLKDITESKDATNTKATAVPSEDRSSE
ncbi:MAG: hypothetical protein NTZ77_00090 [Caldiserica bacterium]|nr:hypothetical protein [Caldisericota bacterium]